MWIQNKRGRVVQVTEEQAQKMLRKGEGFIVEAPKSKPVSENPQGSIKDTNREIYFTEKYDKNLPLISVIIPSRVGEEVESLKSLAKQTYKNLEVIIEYDYKKQGASTMRNRGWDKASGKYVFFCDNDLDIEPDAIECLYKEMIRKKAQWVFGKFYIDGMIFNEGRNVAEIPKDQDTEEFIQWFHGIGTGCLMDASIKLRYEEWLGRFEDWDLWIRVYKSGITPVFLNKVIFKTVNRPQGISMKNNMQHFLTKLYWKHGLSKLAERKKIADIIIPHCERHDRLKECLECLAPDLFNIIVVSGGSFAENCNKGAKIATTDNLIFLNDDTIPQEEALVEMVENSADLVGVHQISPKHQGIIFTGIFYELRDGVLRPGLSRGNDPIHIPSGFCFRVKKNVWEKLGGLDESFKNGAEDQDFGFRALEAGFTVGIVDKPIKHYLSESETRFKYANENRKLFDEKWPKEKIIKLLNL
jgi:GT2 family glycosyltransferase